MSANSYTQDMDNPPPWNLEATENALSQYFSQQNLTRPDDWQKFCRAYDSDLGRRVIIWGEYFITYFIDSNQVSKELLEIRELLDQLIDRMDQLPMIAQSCIGWLNRADEKDYPRLSELAERIVQAGLPRLPRGAFAKPILMNENIILKKVIDTVIPKLPKYSPSWANADLIVLIMGINSLHLTEPYQKWFPRKIDIDQIEMRNFIAALASGRDINLDYLQENWDYISTWKALDAYQRVTLPARPLGS